MKTKRKVTSRRLERCQGRLRAKLCLSTAKNALMVVHLFDCNGLWFLLSRCRLWVLYWQRSLLMFVEILTRGIRNLPFCLGISGIQCSFVVIVRACQTSHQREAADALEAVTESTPPVHPEVCSGCNQTIKTHVTCVGHAAAACDWECRSRSACCPRRDVVRGWQDRDGLCFLVAPRCEKIGERGRRKRHHVEDE